MTRVRPAAEQGWKSLKEAQIKVNSELIKFTEVKHKRLLKATTMEREKLIFAENSYNLCAVVVGAFKAYNKKLTTKLLCSSPIFLLGWFGSFALQNLQAFSNNK